MCVYRCVCCVWSCPLAPCAILGSAHGEPNQVEAVGSYLHIRWVFFVFFCIFNQLLEATFSLLHLLLTSFPLSIQSSTCKNCTFLCPPKWTCHSFYRLLFYPSSKMAKGEEKASFWRASRWLKQRAYLSNLHKDIHIKAQIKTPAHSMDFYQSIHFLLFFSSCIFFFSLSLSHSSFALYFSERY